MPGFLPDVMRMPKKSRDSLPPWLPDTLKQRLDAPPPREGRPGKAPKGGQRGKTATASSGSNRPRPPARAAAFDPQAEREAARYERPIVSREGILQFLSDYGEPLEAERIAHALGLRAPDRFDALSRRLTAMVRDGQLLMNRRGAYAPAQHLDLIPGVVIANADGFGFLRPDAGGDDLFLPPAQMREVMHGDRVLCAVAGIDARGRREGAVVEVLERRTTRLVGRYQERDGIGLVLPDDRRLNQDIVVPADARESARPGQIVVVEITAPPSRGRPPFGRILTVLGDALTPSLVVEMAINSHGIPREWPQAALDEANRVPLEVRAEDIDERVDLRGLPLVTIDGETAKDFDDAVYCEPSKRGFRLLVAIADVSHYVRPGTPLDDEASKRATSVYFPGFVVPMLPETLSNGICSLNPKVDRLCFVCDMQIDHEGIVQKSVFYEAVMRSQARLTYTQVWAAIGENDAEARGQLGEVLPHVERLHQLFQLLQKQRTLRGAIEFDSPEIDFRLGPDGEVVQAQSTERNDAHKLIEECMIAANVEAAKYLLKKKLPTPYRVHDKPPQSKFDELQAFLSEFGLRLPAWERVTPHDFTTLLRKVRKRADAALLEQVLLRSQALAVYQPENIGHFGLALEAYAHFTSPIRRYPDLLVHRAIKHALRGGSPDGYVYAAHEMAALALHCSECGRRADEAEREVDERYRCAWMERHVGSEFAGVVSGVQSFGLFIELVESRISGLVHVTQLPNDYYHFDPQRKLMEGERSGLVLRLGDPVRVLVLRASLEDRKIDFRLTEHNGTPLLGSGRPLPQRRPPGKGKR
jgi:ribonuclease R